MCPTVSSKLGLMKSFCSRVFHASLPIVFILLYCIHWVASLLVKTVAASWSTNNQHVPYIKLSCWLPGLSGKKDFCRTIGFLCFMRSAQGTGRIRGSDNSTHCSKMDSDNLPKSIQIFVSWLCVILILNLITNISSGWLPICYYPVYHPLFDIYLFKMKMIFAPGR